MAQLTNDCFAVDDRPLSLDDAVGLIKAKIGCVVDVETVSLVEADGRILAEDVTAPDDLPRFDNSAVDGYAVCFDDLSASGTTIMPVAARIAAGATATSIEHGSSARIFTGAPMPAGLDTVFMQEDVRTDEMGRVHLPAGLKRGANRRLAGEDLGRGDLALAAGRRLVPENLSLLGALGHASLSVRRRLRVAVFSTGDEIVATTGSLEGSRIFDANRPLLLSWLRRLGCQVSDLGVIPDRVIELAAALERAADEHDLIVTSGGVSVGDEDHVRPAIQARGGALTFWRLDIKPGRPVAMGVVAGTPLIGLPGNPVAVFVTFAMLARPLIARMIGETYSAPMALPVAAGFPWSKKVGRREFVRVKLERTVSGLVAHKHPRNGAGIVTSLTDTDGLLVLPEHTPGVQPGDIVDFLSYVSIR